MDAELDEVAREDEVDRPIKPTLPVSSSPGSTAELSGGEHEYNAPADDVCGERPVITRSPAASAGPGCQLRRPSDHLQIRAPLVKKNA